MGPRAQRSDHKAKDLNGSLFDSSLGLFMRAFVLATILVAAAFAGCTEKVGLDSASADSASFKLEPTTGGKDTVFKVDAGKLAKNNVTWDWGDGTVSYGAKAEHKYNFTNGVMTVTLIATDKDGKQGIATGKVTLGSGKNALPNVTVRAAKAWVEVRKPVNLTATTRDTDRDPITHLWTYSILSGGASGDGHAHDHGAAPTATGQEFVIEGNAAKASVLFDTPGRYLIKVRASDPKGGESVAQTAVDVSRHIPEPTFQTTFEGVVGAGTAGAGVSQTLWGVPADVPDTNVDVVRHPVSLLYPANVVIILQWNDTAAEQTGMAATDLDLEFRNADNGTTIFKSENRVAPGPPPSVPPPFEYNITQVPPANYEVIVRGFAGAQITYKVTFFASLRLTPELVAAAEGN